MAEKVKKFSRTFFFAWNSKWGGVAGLGNRTASDETQSYATVVKMMETVKQQSENLGDLFRHDDPGSPPPGSPGLQERMEAVTQTVQRLETQAATVIQVRQGIWVK